MICPNVFGFCYNDSVLSLFKFLSYGVFFGFFWGLLRALMLGIFERKEA